MDMNTIFSNVAKALFDGAPVFGGMASAGETTKSVLEKVQAAMAEAKDAYDGVIGKEAEYDTFKNAEESAAYLLCIMSEGVFPQEDTPYDSDWGHTFDSVCASCLNISFAYELLKNGAVTVSAIYDESIDDEDVAEEPAAEKDVAEKAATEKAAAEKAAAEKAEHKAEVARQAKAAAVAATDEATKKAAEEKLVAEKAAAKKAAKNGKKPSLIQKAKSFLNGEDDEPESKPKKRNRKKSADILEDFVDE